MLLFDDTSKRGSDAGSYQPGDNLRNSQTPSNPSANDPGYASMNAGQEIDPETESYSSNNPAGGAPSNFEDSEYPTMNREGIRGDDFSNEYAKQRRGNLIAQAKRGLGRAQATVQRTIPKKIGEALGDKQLFNGSSEADKEKAKEFAKEKVRKFAQDRIGKKIGGDALKKGFEKGLSKGVGSLAKGAAKAAGKATGKALGKAGAKATAQAATKGAQAAITAAGGATGAATLGVGFLLSILINIAISLGIDDIVEAEFALKEGDVKQWTFLNIRAGAKVGMFIVFLLSCITIFSVGGIIFGGPVLIVLNIYMILGLVFKNFAPLQGFVWWEIAIIIAMDIVAFLIFVAFLAGIVYYLCSTSGLSSGGAQGALTGLAVGVYDWWNGSQAGGFAQAACINVNAVPAVQ